MAYVTHKDPMTIQAMGEDGLWRQIKGHDGALDVYPADMIPRLSVTPTVSTAPQSSQLWDAGGSNLIYDWRFTVNAEDSIVAGSRLLNGYPDTSVVLAGDAIKITANTAIKRLDVVAIGSAATHAAAGGTILLGTSTEANTRAAMQTFTWQESDQIRTVVLTAGALFGSSRYGRTHVEGFSNG